MALISNNNFSNDSFGVRSERLLAIEGNSETLLSLLTLPDSISEWTGSCSQNFLSVLSISQAEKNEAETATMRIVSAEENISRYYQDAKRIAGFLYQDKPLVYNDYKFDEVFPIRRIEKFHKANSVIEVYNRHLDDGIAPEMPSDLMQNFMDAISEYNQAAKSKHKDSTDSSYKYEKLMEVFNNDTKMLIGLRAFWYTYMGQNDSRIGLLGMVNPQHDEKGGGISLPAPTNFRYDFADRTVRWNAVNGATSYQLEVSDDNTVWDVMYDGEETEYFTGEILPDHKYLRVRSRSSQGMSNPAELPIVYKYNLNGPINLSHNPALPGFTWDQVPAALAYEVQVRLASGTDDDYNLIYFGNDTTLLHGDPIGSYYVRARSWNNESVSGWMLLAYIVN